MIFNSRKYIFYVNDRWTIHRLETTQKLEELETIFLHVPLYIVGASSIG